MRSSARLLTFARLSLLPASLACGALFHAAAAAADTIPGTSAPLTFPGHEDRMTLGPDGNIWFIDRQANAIGRLTGAGVFTSFPIPTAGAQGERIIAGSDGNLWFTEASRQNVARITTDGVITEFPVTGSPFDIIEGPDGNRWFNDAAGKIRRIQEDGTLTIFSTAPYPPYHMGTTGPDGNLWYISSSTNTVVKMTVSGALTGYPFPSPNNGFLGLFMVAGPDGNLWATHGNNIARITTDGVITEYPVPTAGADPSGITIGSDSNIWFTEYSAGKIGQLIVSTATSSGQATINESDSLGANLGEIFPLPSPGFGASAIGVRPEDAGQCPQPTYAVDTSRSSRNISAYALPKATACADLDLKVTGEVSCGYDRSQSGSGAVCTVYLYNAGPDRATGINLHVYHTNFSCQSSCGDCDKLSGVCVVGGLEAKTFFVAYYYFSASAGSFRASVSASTFDNDPRNNESARIPYGTLFIEPPSTGVVDSSPPPRRGPGQ